MKSSFYLPIVAALGLSGFIVAGAWTDAPSTAAPGDNVAAPLNVGDDSQTKLGSLILNADTATPDTVGLDVFGDARVFGRFSSDTDVCIENETQTICLSDLATLSKDYNLTTNTTCTEVYNSLVPTATDPVGVRGRSGWTASVPIPSSCFSDAGCVIKQEIYSSKGLHRVLMNDFYQDPTTNIWSSTYNRTGSRRNGNTTTENIVKPVGSSDYGWLVVRDDRAQVNNIGSNAGTRYVETEANRISFYDSMSLYGHKISFCATDSVLTADQTGDGV